MTALDLISSAMRLTGSLAQGESPSNDEAVDFLQTLNDLIDGWAAEPAMQYAKDIASYALTPGIGAYTIGSTAPAPFNVARPTKVERARFIQSVTLLGFELDLYNAAQWQAIREKTNTAQVPNILYPDYAFPLMGLNLNPVPSLGGLLELTTWHGIQQLVALTTATVLPPAYSEALRFGLAVRIAPELGMQLDPLIVQIAQARKQAIEQFNMAIQLGMGEGTPPAPPMTDQPGSMQPSQQ